MLEVNDALTQNEIQCSGDLLTMRLDFIHLSNLLLLQLRKSG